MGNHELAVQDFDKAILKEAEYSKSYFHRATSKFKAAQIMQGTEKQRRIDDALEDFTKSLSLDTEGENPGILDGLGCCYHEMKDYEKAQENFDDAIEKTTDNKLLIEFLKNRSQCYYDMGEYENSIQDLTQGLSFNNKDPQVLYKLGLTYFADKRFKKCT